VIWVRRAGHIACVATLAVACGRPETPARSHESAGRDATPADRLLAAGDSLYDHGEYDSARTVLERAVTGAGGAGDSVVVARGWTSLGILARRQSRFDDAQVIGDRALALKQRLGLSNELARSLNALGNIANDRGDLGAAISLFRSARDAAAAAHDSIYIARARGNLGLVYANAGQFDSGRVEMEALRQAAAARGDSRDEANALDNRGMLESRAGFPTRAIEWLERARQRYRETSYAVGEENTLGQLGLAYEELGETVRAFAYLDSALTVATRNGFLEPEADDLQAIAELYENLGDHRHALESLRRARSLDDSLGFKSKAGHALLTEARAYENLGMLNLAATRAREAARLEHDASAGLDELDGRVFDAELEARGGRPEAATIALARAATLADSLGTGVARIRFALGTARVDDLAHRDSRVLSALRRIAGDTVLLTPDEQSEFHDLEARALYRRGNYETAARAGRAAVRAAEQIRGRIGSAALRTSYISARSQTYADLVVILLAMGKADDAFRVADAARGRALIEQLGTARKDASRAGAPVHFGGADSLLGRIDDLVNRLRIADSTGGRRSSPRSDRGIESIEHDLAVTRSAYDSLVDHFAEQDPSGPILGTYTVDVTAIRNSLAPNERLLDYFATDDRLVVFVLSRQALAVVAVPASRDSLAEQVRLARDVVAQRGSTIAPSLNQLYARLISPLEQRGLLRGVDGLIIVPHGALTYLPFAALRDSASGHYLVERFSILTLTSASALVPLRRRAGPASGGAGVFAPLPGSLPGSRVEAAAVSRVLGVRAELGANASEHAVRLGLRNASIVHVATHGTVDADHPLFSGVQLAATTGRSSPDDDGLLETHEVLTLDVRSPLVFLSGCETALGVYRPAGIDRGEDYATLAQAFLFAGARNVVATLWRIDDKGASEFARKFYVDLATRSPASALAAAQRELIQDVRYASPYYWAGYTVSGAGTMR
jgi:CHAT domain-containing protein/tetratricopeptide (TPR) repeat protein